MPQQDKPTPHLDNKAEQAREEIGSAVRRALNAFPLGPHTGVTVDTCRCRLDMFQSALASFHDNASQQTCRYSSDVTASGPFLTRQI